VKGKDIFGGLVGAGTIVSSLSVVMSLIIPKTLLK
jgi:hypothetical protein